MVRESWSCPSINFILIPDMKLAVHLAIVLSKSSFLVGLLVSSLKLIDYNALHSVIKWRLNNPKRFNHQYEEMILVYSAAFIQLQRLLLNSNFYFKLFFVEALANQLNPNNISGVQPPKLSTLQFRKES